MDKHSTEIVLDIISDIVIGFPAIVIAVVSMLAWHIAYSMYVIVSEGREGRFKRINR